MDGEGTWNREQEWLGLQMTRRRGDALIARRAAGEAIIKNPRVRMIFFILHRHCVALRPVSGAPKGCGEREAGVAPGGLRPMPTRRARTPRATGENRHKCGKGGAAAGRAGAILR